MICLLLDCIFVHQRLPHERVHLLNSTCFFGGKPPHDFCFLLFNRSYSDVHGLRKTEMTYSSFWLCRKLGGWNLSCCFCFEWLNNCKSALTTFQLCNTCPTLSTTSPKWNKRSVVVVLTAAMAFFRRSGTLSGGRRCQKKKRDLHAPSRRRRGKMLCAVL